MTRMLAVNLASKNDLERATQGLVFAKKTKKMNLLSDFRVLFFGPGVELLDPDAEHYPNLRKLLDELRAYDSQASACISNVSKYRLSEKLEKELVTMEEAAYLITDSVKNGYQAISF